MKKSPLLSPNFKLEKVPEVCDYLGILLLIFVLVILITGMKLGKESSMSLLLALIILIAAYNIEIAILLTALAIIFILVQNYVRRKKDNNRNN